MNRSSLLWITSTGRPRKVAAACSGQTRRSSVPASQRPISSAPGSSQPGRPPESLRYWRSIISAKSANALSTTSARSIGSSAAASNAVAAPIEAPSTPIASAG